MKPIRLIFLLVLVFYACDPKSIDDQSASLGQTDSLLMIKEQLIDPDRTDQIPGNQYLIDASSEATAARVRERLKQLFAEDLNNGVVDSLSRKFIFFEFDLNGDQRKEIFVGLIGPYFCGTGGCTQFILNEQAEVFARFTVSDYPVVISQDRTQGWRDLYLLSGSSYREVKFDGKSYPGNPSLMPELATIPGDGLPRALDFINDKYPWFRF